MYQAGFQSGFSRAVAILKPAILLLDKDHVSSSEDVIRFYFVNILLDYFSVNCEKIYSNEIIASCVVTSDSKKDIFNKTSIY